MARTNTLTTHNHQNHNNNGNTNIVNNIFDAHSLSTTSSSSSSNQSNGNDPLGINIIRNNRSLHPRRKQHIIDHRLRNGLPHSVDVPYSPPTEQYHSPIYVNNNHNNTLVHNPNQMLMQQFQQHQLSQPHLQQQQMQQQQFQQQQLTQPYFQQPPMTATHRQSSSIWPNFNPAQFEMQQQQSLLLRQQYMQRQRQIIQEDASRHGELRF